MKKLTKLLLGLLFTMPTLAQMEVEQEDSITTSFEEQAQHVIQHLNLSEVETGLLSDIAFDLVELSHYTGLNPDSIPAMTINDFSFLYMTLFGAAISAQYKLPEPETVYMDQRDALTTEDTNIPIAFLHVDYHSFKEDVIEKKLAVK